MAGPKVRPGLGPWLGLRPRSGPGLGAPGIGGRVRGRAMARAMARTMARAMARVQIAMQAPDSKMMKYCLANLDSS